MSLAPAIDASTGDYTGWITVGGVLRQILHSLYPALLNPDLVSQDDMESTLYDESLNESCEPQSHFQCMASYARGAGRTTWSQIIRPSYNDDGDVCYLGFADTTLLDFVSRGLDARSADEKRIGDFEPCHRIAVFTERLHECVVDSDSGRVRGAGGGDGPARDQQVEPGTGEEKGVKRNERGGGGPSFGGGGEEGREGPEKDDKKDEDEDEDEDVEGLDIELADMRPRWVSVVSQLDVIDLMVRDADSLGAFPHVYTMERLGFATNWGVVAVASTLPTAACFAIMHNAGVSGVAVLDRAKRFLIGSLSVSDIRHVNSPDLLDALNQPVGEFLRDRIWSETPGTHPKPPPGAAAAAAAAVAEAGPRSSSRGSSSSSSSSPGARGSCEDPVLNGVWWRARTLTVSPKAPLIAAMRAMSAGRVHRVYVADSPHSPPLGVCTCTDVMRLFAVDPDQAEGRARLTW